MPLPRRPRNIRRKPTDSNQLTNKAATTNTKPTVVAVRPVPPLAWYSSGSIVNGDAVEEGKIFRQMQQDDTPPKPQYPEPVQKWLHNCTSTPSESLLRFIEWRFTLSKMFDWSLATRIGKVPDFMVPEFIFCHELLLDVHVNTPERLVLEWGGFGQSSSMKLRTPIIEAYMRSVVGRYEDAVRLAKEQIDHHVRHLRNIGSPLALVDRPWDSCPDLCLQYANARVLAGHLDIETKELLEAVLAHPYSQHPPKSPDPPKFALGAITTRINLALVLQHLNLDKDIQKLHTQWAVEYLRPRRTAIQRIELFLRPPSLQITHPVSESLGNEWFGNAKFTDRESAPADKHFTAQVFVKKIIDPDTAFSRQISEMRAEVQRRRQNEPTARIVLRKAFKWMKSNIFANHHALVWSLGVPSCIACSFMHIVVRTIVYVPNAEDHQRSFVVRQWGVYKIEEAMQALTCCLGKSEREVREMIECIMGDTHVARITDPLLHITIIQDAHGRWVSSGLFCQYTTGVDFTSCPPTCFDWREKTNANGMIPERPILPGNPPDRHLCSCGHSSHAH
ncbi:hypothetical protein EIP91_001061 [Steccherinum ochraceum]|uniref:Uncharacterized protein n=1 Tax=Steccherinum ochraceum TaxID=92696 RepID=A0A4R0RV98_9APHY|nr:hypothetical protein EIP91_001061 [Steccherinum ochraceum]